MIQVGQFPFQYISNQLKGLTSIQREILESLQKNKTFFYYSSVKELMFEIKVREEIINAAKMLNDSGVEFTSFKRSKFNPKYWIKTNKGYFLKNNALPSEAINDIFKSGHLYAFECSTAIVVIYYKAVMESISHLHFNRLFQNLLVWDWNYDNDLKIITTKGTDLIPGDVVYFYNPDYKNPVWMGENTVFLGNNQFFGHGIGIGTAEEMIKALNTLRKKNSTQSAYLLNQKSRLNFDYLFQFAHF